MPIRHDNSNGVVVVVVDLIVVVVIHYYLLQWNWWLVWDRNLGAIGLDIRRTKTAIFAKKIIRIMFNEEHREEDIMPANIKRECSNIALSTSYLTA